MHVNAGALAQFKTNMTQRLNKRRQRGVTLVELAVAVAVMGLIMAGAMVGVPRLMASVKLNQEIKDWQMASLAVQNMVMGGSFPTTDLATNIPTSPVVEGFNRNGTKILNRFGGAVSFDSVPGDYPSTGMQVVSEGYPSAQCVDFVTKMYPTFSTITVGSIAVKTKDSNDMSGIQTACTTGPVPVGGGAAPAISATNVTFTISG
ncbi:prepilin-type cleavage/methylation domain-containing protein [Pandoraea pneumonica]|uniref:Prepilin-type cleavage/methylation domain-containing protein n=2 Tax=Pandoraea pneumonica TaxID=2508299 RepID=A0A5E4V259_9BURK|nr:prepilin-type cleavage/methylation domain-containing protein [Pandoraea pneumonica]